MAQYIRPTLKITKEEMEFVRDVVSVADDFNFNLSEIFGAIYDHAGGLGPLEFEFED